jgi:hypothetical protein
LEANDRSIAALFGRLATASSVSSRSLQQHSKCHSANAIGISRFEHDSHAGDAVLIAPVSSRIPCKRGILQEISQNLALEKSPLCKKRLSRSDFLQDSLPNLSGKVCSQTGILIA